VRLYQLSTRVKDLSRTAGTTNKRERANEMNKELLLEKLYTELNKVIEEITEKSSKDEMIPTLSGWELSLKWVIKQVEEASV
jgi:hypothetical protein